MIRAEIEHEQTEQTSKNYLTTSSYVSLATAVCTTHTIYCQKCYTIHMKYKSNPRPIYAGRLYFDDIMCMWYKEQWNKIKIQDRQTQRL